MQAGVAEERIKEWESFRRVPSRAELKDIANAFNVSVFELLSPSALPGQITPTPSDQLAPPHFEWDEIKQQLWGALPYALWGYLRLQLTAAEQPRWYPVSGEQAASIDNQMRHPGWSTMIVGQTLSNRCVSFAPGRVTSVSLVDKSTATSRTDFALSWDAEGHPPELYKALRAWAQRDVVEYFAMSQSFSAIMTQIRQARTIYTRKKALSLVDHTVIRLTDSRVARFSATARSLHSAVRSVRLGALTVYLAEYETGEEHLVALDQVRAIDMPATDLELVSNAVVMR